MKKLKKTFYLGVEGGATKSDAILCDENLKIVAQGKGKALNWHDLKTDTVRKNLAGLISPLTKKTKGAKIYGIFGLSGVNTPKDKVFYTKLVRSVLPKGARFEVVNDSKVALESCCPEAINRIAVISGTGSNVYGENGSVTAWAVGWGFLLGDEGGGYDLGLKAVRAAIRSWDGRSKKTVLEDLVLEGMKAKTMEDFHSKFLDNVSKSESIKQYVSSFAPLLDKAILQGDWAAIKIRDRGAKELAKGVFAVASRLGFERERFCVGITGSQWKMPGLREVFEEEVKKQCPNVQFSKSAGSGVWGAVLLAKKSS